MNRTEYNSLLNNTWIMDGLSKHFHAFSGFCVGTSRTVEELLIVYEVLMKYCLSLSQEAINLTFNLWFSTTLLYQT